MSAGSLKRLMSQVRDLEHGYGRCYDAYLVGLSSEEFLAEFMRVTTCERGWFTVEELEGHIGATGGNVNEWRDLLCGLLVRCEAVSGKQGAPWTRYRYVGK